MASRLYLPWGGTPQITPAADAGWAGDSASFAAHPTATTKSDTALVDKTATFDGVSTSRRIGQWVSPALSAGAIAGTVSMVVRGLEADTLDNAHLVFSLRVMKADLALRGTLLTMFTTTSEYATTAETRIHSALALTEVVAVGGDYLVMELGMRGTNSGTGTLRFGAPIATGDFALTSGLTTDLCPWFELSQNISFAGGATVAASAPFAVQQRMG